MIKIIVALLGICCLTSCATVFTGHQDPLHMTSNPDGASVYRHGRRICRTPCSIMLDRSLWHTHLVVSKKGYEPQTIKIKKHFNTVSIFNLAFIMGWWVDMATGSMMRYDHLSYEVELPLKR